MEVGGPILIVLVIALVITAAIFGHIAAKKRREALAALADSLGWSYDPDHTTAGTAPLEHFDMFNRGRSRRAYNTLWGTLDTDGIDCSAQAGDYRYKVTRGSGKNRRTHTYRFSYLIFRLPFRGVPDLTIRREGLFDKISGAFGFDDIDFESAEFSKKYYVQSSDRRFAYDLIHPRMMEFLLRVHPPRIDFSGGYVLLTDGKSTWQAEQFERRLAFAREFLELWPAHLADSLQA